jgi:hypothetical protein
MEEIFLRDESTELNKSFCTYVLWVSLKSVEPFIFTIRVFFFWVPKCYKQFYCLKLTNQKCFYVSTRNSKIYSIIFTELHEVLYLQGRYWLVLCDCRTKGTNMTMLYTNMKQVALHSLFVTSERVPESCCELLMGPIVSRSVVCHLLCVCVCVCVCVQRGGGNLTSIE